MFFVAPLWICILIPILLAPFPLGVSLVIRQRRAPAFEAAYLAIAGFAISFVLGGVLLMAVLVAFILVTHQAAQSIGASVADADPSQPFPSRAQVTTTVAIVAQIGLIAAAAHGALADGPVSHIAGTLVPFGVSYFAFHGISYVMDVHRGRVAAEQSILRLSVYLVLLPQVAAGPVAYAGAAPQLTRRLASVSDYSFGVRRMVIGLWKVFAMAALAAVQADAVFAVRPERLSVLAAWVGLASFTLQIYYTFSGYADMAVGLARMFGIRLPENFRWPLAAESVREFWRRWHVGLSSWFREYGIGAESLVALLCGLWYGLAWTFVVWGVYHALLIVVERSGLERVMKRLPKTLRHVYLVLAASLGWLVLRSAAPGDAWAYARALSGVHAAVQPAAITFGYDAWLTLAAGALGCAPLAPMIRRWTVAIDALIIAGLMLFLASLLFTWRGVRMLTAPAIRFWRGTPGPARRS